MINLLCGNLADFQLAEIREYLRADDMLLCQPSVFFQTIFHIIDIQFRKGFKTHIKVRRVLQLEHSLPFLRFFLCGETPFTLLLAFAFPIHIPRHYIPSAVVLIFEYWHYLLSFPAP